MGPGVRRGDDNYLLIPRIEIVARAGRSGHVVVGTWAVRPAAAARETVTAAIAFETAGRAVHLRLRPGDEGGQAIDAAGIGNHRLRLGLGLRLILRLRAMLALAMMFARLLVAVTLVGLPLARLEIALIIFARHERLLLLRHKARLLAEVRKTLALVLSFLGRHFIVGARLRLVLPELLLGRRDQAEIMFGVLVVIFSRDRIAGRARIARQLNVFFRNVGGGTTDLDIGSVRFEHPGHRVLSAPVIVVVIVVIPVTHPLVVLTVSHVSPLIPALKLCR